MDIGWSVMVGFQPEDDYDHHWEGRGRRFAEKELSSVPAFDFGDRKFDINESDGSFYHDVVGLCVAESFDEVVMWIEPQDIKEAIERAEMLVEPFKEFMREHLPEEHKHYAEDIDVLIPIVAPY